MPPIPVDLWEWEFYYPPVAYTGHFWTQGDPGGTNPPFDASLCPRSSHRISQLRYWEFGQSI